MVRGGWNLLKPIYWEYFKENENKIIYYTAEWLPLLLKYQVKLLISIVSI